MVWNTTQSTLYKAVNDYNKTIDETHCKHSDTDRSESVCICDNKCEHQCDNPKIHDYIHKTPFQNCKTNSQNANFRSPLPYIDKDFLLLAGLIYILWKEGADQKLILALVMVLLG